MKPVRILLIASLTAFLLISCATSDSGKDQYSPYVMEWRCDASAEAVRSKTLNFWFMSSEGFIIGSSSEAADKWGDAFLIVFPNGQTMLVDSGFGSYAPILVRNLKRLGIKKLDYLMISHQHDDHVGGVVFPVGPGILGEFEVGEALYTGVRNPGWRNKLALENALDEYGIPNKALHDGDTLQIGEVKLTILNPPDSISGTDIAGAKDMNNSSLVVRLDYGDFSALLTGDLYLSGELDLIKRHEDLLDVDLLKIPHHGHDTSNSEEFIKATSPTIAVAMGHVLIATTKYADYLKHGASAVLMDYSDGYIHVLSDGNNLQWECSRERTIQNYLKYDKAYGR